MSYALRISLTFNSLRETKPLCFSRDRNGFYQHFSIPAAIRTASLVTNRCVCSRKTHVIDGCIKASTRQSEEGPVLGNDQSPVSVELEPISSESQFDRVLAQAQQLEESVVILWMASWCRKCVYLKPKLEKLAADYYPRIRFHCVDVNNVPHKLVVRAGVTVVDTLLYLFMHVGDSETRAENAYHTVVEG